MSDGRVSVVIADDHAAIRSGIAMMATGAGIDVVAEAENGESAVVSTRTHRPDVVVMDIRMPQLDGIAATRRITTTTSSRVLILTTFGLDEYVFGALRAGASGFLIKTASADEVVGAIRTVADGGSVLAPGATRALIDRFVRSPTPAEPPEALENLTDRERQVFALLGRGLSNDELAMELRVAPPTVKTHVSRVLTKLHLTSRVQAAILARELGFHT